MTCPGFLPQSKDMLFRCITDFKLTICVNTSVNVVLYVCQLCYTLGTCPENNPLFAYCELGSGPANPG